MFPVMLHSLLIYQLNLFCWKLWHKRLQRFTYIVLLIAHPPFALVLSALEGQCLSMVRFDWFSSVLAALESQWCECCLQSVQSVPSPANLTLYGNVQFPYRDTILHAACHLLRWWETLTAAWVAHSTLKNRFATKKRLLLCSCDIVQTVTRNQDTQMHS